MKYRVSYDWYSYTSTWGYSKTPVNSYTKTYRWKWLAKWQANAYNYASGLAGGYCRTKFVESVF